MKIKNYNIKKLFLYGIGVSLFFSCTEGFEELNESEYGVTKEQKESDYATLTAPLKAMQNSVYKYDPVWQTQLQQNLLGDVYSGYMRSPTPFVANANNMNYSLVDNWNGFPWSIGYEDIMTNWYRVKNVNVKDEYPDFYAISLILKVLAMHRVSDIYGPIIYSDYGTESSNYDPQDKVYDRFFKELDTAVDALQKRVDNSLDSRLSLADNTLFAKDQSKWVKFANSLRLRLAIRVSNISPDLAKKEAEKAVSQKSGLITTNAENAVVTSANYKHPLSTISNNWGDVRMGADMESYLVGYADPRIDKYFKVTTPDGDDDKPLVGTTYKGIRNGISINKKSEYVNYSALGSVIETNNIVWMNAAEVSFLKAEGALRGWNMGGTAKDFYEAGINLSFDQYGIKDAAYLTDATKTPAAYEDPKNADNNSSNISDITIAWDAADTKEKQLERIIVQKWIAIFPDGQEAWSEFRRTGYPRLFTVVENKSNGKISTKEFIKRINFVLNERNTNAAGVESGKKALGGEDDGGTALWWDVTSASNPQNKL